MEDLIQRRVEFLLNEARLGAKRDQVITFAMRVISNHATVGQDAQSSAVKRLNRNVSLAALQLLREVSTFAEWTKQTTNDHQLPLKPIWDWMLQNADALSAGDVWDHFTNNPMVTILKSEDNHLNANGLRSSDVTNRYSAIGINPVVIKVKPIDAFREQRFEHS